MDFETAKTMVEKYKTSGDVKMAPIQRFEKESEQDADKALVDLMEKVENVQSFSR